MATGDDFFDTQAYRATKLLDQVTATNGAPSAATAGVAMKDFNRPYVASREASVVVVSTAGSGTMTVTIKMWGYLAAASRWVPLGKNSTAATKGILNDGNAIAETGTDSIGHAEPLLFAGHFDRIYAEVTAIGGTDTAITVWLVVPRNLNDR